MLRLLLRKEMLALSRDGRLLVMGAVLLALCISVFLLAHSATTQLRLEKSEAEQASRLQWDTQGENHPHRGAHFGLYVFAPESPLASFDPGINRFLGQALWLEPHRRNILRFSEASDDPVSSRFGSFSLAFVMTAVLPLLLMAIAAGVVAQEKESGTLRLVHNYARKPALLIWGKFLALLGLAAGFLVLILLIVAASALPGQGKGDAVARIVLLGMSLLMYYAIYIALGMSVSALTGNGRKAFAVIVFVWLLFVFIAPRAGAALSDKLVALPTPAQFWNDIRHDYENGLPGDGDLASRSRQFDEELLARYGVQHLEDMPVGAYALRRLKRDEYADKVHALHFDRLWKHFYRQQSILRAASLVTPSISMRLASMTLSGTDLSHRDHFESAAEAYRRYFNTAIDEWDINNSQGLRSFDDKYGSNDLWQSIRTFNYRQPPAGFALKQAAYDLIILAAWMLAALLLLAYAARRLKP